MLNFTSQTTTLLTMLAPDIFYSLKFEKHHIHKYYLRQPFGFNNQQKRNGNT